MRHMIAALKPNTCVGHSTETWISVQCLVLCLTIFTTGFAIAGPSDENAWLVCEENADCTSVKVGCFYWQPVNKKYADDMKAARNTKCNKVRSPGPEPTAICSNHYCVNGPFTVKDWELWRTEPVQEISGAKPMVRPDRSEFIVDRMYSCLKGTVGIDDFITLRDSLQDSYLQKINDLIREKKFMEGRLLDDVFEAAMSCENLISKAHSLQKK